jgi:hypothetical protein
MLFAFILGGMTFVVSCQQEESDYEQGKADGKAACDCYSKSSSTVDEAICDGKIDNSRMGEGSDYAKGVYEVIEACESLQSNYQ